MAVTLLDIRICPPPFAAGLWRQTDAVKEPDMLYEHSECPQAGTSLLVLFKLRSMSPPSEPLMQLVEIPFNQKYHYFAVSE